MKRVMALMLVGMLLFALPACSGVKLTEPEAIPQGNNTTVVRDYEDGDLQNFSDYLAQEQQRAEQQQQQEQQAQQQQTPVVAPTVPAVLPEQTPQPESQAPQPEPQTPQTEQPKDLSVPSRGRFENGDYINEYLGWNLQLPDTWSYYNDAQISAFTGYESSAYSLENMLVESSPISAAYEMMAADVYGQYLLVQYVSLIKTGEQDKAEMDYLYTLYQQLDQIEGVECNWTTNHSYRLGGQVFRTLEINHSYGGKPIQQHMMLQKKGDYMVLATLILQGETDFKEFLEYIKPYGA